RHAHAGRPAFFVGDAAGAMPTRAGRCRAGADVADGGSRRFAQLLKRVQPDAKSGSRSGSGADAGSANCSDAQAPRSICRQRALQNGRYGLLVAYTLGPPQAGHFTVLWAAVMGA